MRDSPWGKEKRLSKWVGKIWGVQKWRCPRTCSIYRYTTPVRPSKTQISLGMRPVRLESLLCAQWVAMDPSFLLADSEDTDHARLMPRLICLRWANRSFCWFCHSPLRNHVKGEAHGQYHPIAIIVTEKIYFNLLNLFLFYFLQTDAKLH